MAYAEVIVDINHHQVDKLFDYGIPPALASQIVVGKRVSVPFANRKLMGFVMGIKSTSQLEKVKDIIEVLDEEPVITEDLLELIKWLADYYCCQQIQVLKSLLPEKVKSFKKNTQKLYSLNLAITDLEGELEKLKKRAPVQFEIVNYIAKQSQWVTTEQLRQNINGDAANPLKVLMQKGFVIVGEGEVDNNPYRDKLFTPSFSFQPNDEQQVAITSLCEAISKDSPSSFLLFGVTGSGKTEVYLQAIAHALSLDKDAIVLVPEIALTPQTVSRFKQRFGNSVAVLHSRLTPNERADQWWRIKRGQVKVVVGARSAIFAPFANLGLIVIDEEHESSYKQEEAPRYHARDVAMKRGELCNCPVVLGTATPALETYFGAVGQSRHQLLTLTKRAKGNLLPKVEVIDLRDELRKGNRSIFSKVLREKILDRITKREQIILFINRRGHSTFVSCRQCGYVAQCTNCAVSLTLHSTGNRLKCHYCDYQTANPTSCPSCGSEHIRHFGLGTQRAEEEVKREFPHARVLRMDVDTTKKRGGHERILDLFSQGRADILIGTQMIAKGLDFPRVTLVGILAADLTLNLPEFRACERTYQLISQVAGRAGRDELAGDVVIQTYMPNNYAIECAKNHDYHGFYVQELKYRQDFDYPPFTKLVRVICSGEDQGLVEMHLNQFSRELQEALGQLPGDYQMIGPLPAPINKLRNLYRYHLLIKGANRDFTTQIKTLSDKYHETEKIRLVVDVDPLNIL